MVAFRNPSEVSLVVMEVRVSPKARKHIEERAAAGKCLHCDSPIYRRGLCTTHYTRYRTARLELPAKERPKHEAEMIERGRIVEKRQGCHRGSVNEFRRVEG